MPGTNSLIYDRTFVIISLIIIALALTTLIIYNVLVNRKNNIKQALGNIDVYLKQRFDLIPNLVETIKGYAKYEKETLTHLTEIRSQFNNSNDVKKKDELNNEFTKILAIVEKYPELKANESYLDLMKQLVKMEKQIQAARRIFNYEVKEYNDLIQKFPSNMFATIFRFKEEKFFEIKNEEEKENIKVEL